MVLDAKAMEWANENGIDTAKLRAAKLPIYGKWYFPDIPANVPLINLKTGELQSFTAGLRAGEVLYVTRADLRRARLGPYASLVESPPPVAAAPAAAVEVASAATDRVEQAEAVEADLPPGVHLPGPSIFPLVLAIGLSIALLGLVAGPVELRVIVTLLGLVYLAAGAFGWVVQNHEAGLALEAGGEQGGATGLD